MRTVFYLTSRPENALNCLTYLKEVGTDMQPLSLRKKMEAATGDS